jgi:hypothetical protein
LGDRSIEGVGPLGHRDLRQIDVAVRPPVAPLGTDYIRPIRDPRASTCFHFHSVLGFRRRAAPSENSSVAELRSAIVTTSHADQVFSAA